MQYQEAFDQFWEQVKESVQEGSFAKLTMAKTIGKPDLRNIFVRPVYSEHGFKVLLKLYYRSRETENREDELTLEEAYDILKAHLKNPFLSVILFTTTMDLTLKINKKGAASITDSLPSFAEANSAKRDVD